MADYLAGFYPEWVDKEENPRQIILDLGKMITNRIPVKLGFQKLNKYDPEYWGLATLLTDEQAEVALKMGVRKPKTMADMVKLTGKSEEELEKILGDMSFMGILEYNWENPTRTKQWVLPMFVPGSAEFTNMNDHPEEISRNGSFLRADESSASGEGHPHGTSRRRRHRHARDPCGKGHRNREPVHFGGTYLPLAG